MPRGDRGGRWRSCGPFRDRACGAAGRTGLRIAGLLAVGLVAATAAASPEPVRGVTAVSEASVPTYPAFRLQAERLVDSLVAAGVLQDLRGRVGRREVDRLVEHWRNVEAKGAAADQVAYILERFDGARSRIDAALTRGAANDARRALTAGPRSPVMEALYMAIVASALEEGRAAFRKGGETSELDGILASFGARFWLIRLVYRIDFPAEAEHRFSRGVDQLAERRNREDSGPAATRFEG